MKADESGSCGGKDRRWPWKLAKGEKGKELRWSSDVLRGVHDVRTTCSFRVFDSGDIASGQ